MSDSSAALFTELVEIFKKLRDPNGGCPWDLKQTHKSLTPHLIEEAYEAVDAIDNAPEKMPEELGDVLLQVLLHSQIGSDERTFTIDDVMTFLRDKLIRRHPHVFGDVKAATAEAALASWERMKHSEKSAKESVLDGIPRHMAALLKSHCLGEKLARVNFDWNTSGEIKEKVREELEEFLCAHQDGSSQEHIAEEFGDLMFTLAQFARKLGFNAEELVTSANEKVIRRFKAIEARIEGLPSEWKRERLETLWSEVKGEEAAQKKKPTS